MASKELFAFDNDEEAKFALRQESKRLRSIALRLWDEYIQDYEPAQYVRTKKSRRGIKLGRLKRLDAYTFGIELIFQDDLMYHDSVMGSKHLQGHSIMLISEGWKVKKGKHKDVYRFGYFEGIDYIGRIQREFEADAIKGITLDVNWNGKQFKKKKYPAKHPNVLRG